MVLKNRSDRRAQPSHVKRAARSRPLLLRSARNVGDVKIRPSADASSPGLPGSTSKAASPTTSGSDDTFDTIVGTPAAMACTGGKPKPSYSDGNANAVAPAVRPGSRDSGTYPS